MIDGRRRAPQLLPRRPSKLRNSQVKQLIDAFEKTGSSNHSGNATMLQYLIDYCEENRIKYLISAWPHEGYYIEKVPDLIYKSKGDPETTKAVQFLLSRSYNQRRFGGPHRWNKRMLRYVGQMMRDYAEYVKSQGS